MKKLIILVFISFAFLSVFAQKFEVGGIAYEINSDGQSVSVVANIAEYTTSIVIPSSVKYNGKDYAVSSIGNEAFSECSFTSITIPNSVTSIDGYAFEFCKSLTNITIPNSVTSIGGRAFQFCESLTSITIPNSVTSIGNEAFRFCKSLTSITIPNSVTSIGNNAFYSCNSLKSINVNGNNPSYSSIDGVLYNKNKTILIHYPIKKAGNSFIIPNSVTSIDGYAFEFCKSLTNITIPNSVTSIGKNAFWSCRSLTNITIPNSVTSIGENAFWSCSSLTNITIPNSVTSIGKTAFLDCKSLTSITAPESLRGTFHIPNEKCKVYYTPNTVVNVDQDVVQNPKENKNNVVVDNDIAKDYNVDKNIPQSIYKKENTFAFIIANENYPQKTVPFALNDGRIFKEYCIKTLGIDKKRVNIYENATGNNIIACVERMKQIATAYEGDANIIFYYSGHAFPDEQRSTGYLLPIDGNSQITATGYALDKLYKELSSVKTKSVVCFIDACFSGATREDEMLLAGRGVAIKVKEEVPKGNIVVFTAATGAETAHQYEEKEHGMFTYFLLKKLQESKGNITLGELSEYIIKNVIRTSSVENPKPQTPTVIPSISLSQSWKNIKL